jgi:hypothetical protein
MSTSTDAILFYGFACDDGDKNHEILCGTDDEPEDGDDEADPQEASEARWRKAFDLPSLADVEKHQEKYPVVIGHHCTCDYMMYYVAIRKTELTASRGCPEKVRSFRVGLEWDDQLREFCKRMGLRAPKQFGWCLVSMWC